MPGKPSPPASTGALAYTVPVILVTDSESALCCTTARDFAVIGGLVTNRYAIRWSALGDATDFPQPATDDARAKQAGQQSFPTEFGWVTGLAGNDFYMYVFQERAISKSTYVGGDVVWSFDTFEEDRGCVRMGRLAQIDDKVFFQSDRGYHVVENDQIADIGYGIIDDTYS